MARGAGFACGEVSSFRGISSLLRRVMRISYAASLDGHEDERANEHRRQ